MGRNPVACTCRHFVLGRARYYYHTFAGGLVRGLSIVDPATVSTTRACHHHFPTSHYTAAEALPACAPHHVEAVETFANRDSSSFLESQSHSLGNSCHARTNTSNQTANMASLTEDGSHRFRKHVTFNNVQIGEPTKNNFPSYTLVVRHLGFYSKRRSRTFMVGIDDHQYSDEALQWLFDKFVEDGDEIICVRVVEKDVRQLENDRRIADFQAEANAEVERIKAKSGDGKAISIVLEYAVGKLHSTFQRLVRSSLVPRTHSMVIPARSALSQARSD